MGRAGVGGARCGCWAVLAGGVLGCLSGGGHMEAVGGGGVGPPLAAPGVRPGSARVAAEGQTQEAALTEPAMCDQFRRPSFIKLVRTAGVAVDLRQGLKWGRAGADRPKCRWHPGTPAIRCANPATVTRSEWSGCTRRCR